MAELKTLWTNRKEEAKKRLLVCGTCDRYDAGTTRCAECGCFMLAKTLWPSSKCPLDKWDFYLEEEENNGISS